MKKEEILFLLIMATVLFMFGMLIKQYEFFYKTEFIFSGKCNCDTYLNNLSSLSLSEMEDNIFIILFLLMLSMAFAIIGLLPMMFKEPRNELAVIALIANIMIGAFGYLTFTELSNGDIETIKRIYRERIVSEKHQNAPLQKETIE